MPPTFFINNRKHLVKKLQNKVIALAAHDLLQQTDDQAYPFRQDSNFWYVTGMDEPGCWLVIDSNGEDHLFIPQPTHFEETWLNKKMNIEEAARLSGVKHVRYLNEKAVIIKKLLVSEQEVHVPLPEKQTHQTMTLNPSHQRLKRTLKRYGAKKIIDCSGVFAELRSIKTPQEIALLAEVTDVTEKILQKTKKIIQQGVYEYELKAYITAEFSRRGYTCGYDPIVASGKNAFFMHYLDGGRKIQKDDFVLIDAGAMKGYYSADVTRMFEVGQPPPGYNEAKQIVYELKDYIAAHIKPGVKILDVAKLFREKLLSTLQTMKLLDNQATAKDTLQYCPHGFGHFLGLDVHDTGDYSATFKKNMVFMIEPGLYVKEWGVAVRYEDAYVITETSCMKLTEVLK